MISTRKRQTTIIPGLMRAPGGKNVSPKKLMRPEVQTCPITQALSI